jgi:hypothetical protein
VAILSAPRSSFLRETELSQLPCCIDFVTVVASGQSQEQQRMQHRLGRCDACRASYQIPNEFKPHFARCPLCRGMVRVGPHGGGEPWRPMPARATAPVLRVHTLQPIVAPTTTAPLCFEEESELALWQHLDGDLLLEKAYSTEPVTSAAPTRRGS